MCFGIIISSPFDQNTLNIPISNIKCPQKSFSSQSLFVKLELCCLCTSMPNPICVTGNAIHESLVPCNALCWDMWSKMKVITEFCYFFFKAWNVLPCVKGDGLQEVKITLFNTNSLVFLGHLIFWMGMFKGFGSNGLEILIPKHMWKSIIGPLEQI